MEEGYRINKNKKLNLKGGFTKIKYARIRGSVGDKDITPVTVHQGRRKQFQIEGAPKVQTTNRT